jgi:microcystin-dependent protein
MTYPPTPPPADRVNTTPQVNTHPSDHNVISEALTDIINELGPNPKGTYSDVDSRLTDLQNLLVPTGSIMEFGAVTPPAGWVICNGAELSRTDPAYAALFAVIGTSYGSGNGTFKLPDFRDKSSIGIGASLTVGTSGGSADLMEHNHGQNAHNHEQNNHTHPIDAHNHIMTHGHAADDSHEGTHTHPTVANSGLPVVYNGGGGSLGLADANVWGGVYGKPLNVGVLNAATTDAGAHNHDIFVTEFTGSVQNNSAGNTAKNAKAAILEAKAVNVKAGTGNNNYHPYLQVNKIIRL